MQEQLTNEQREAHWKKTRNLMVISLLIWFVFSFAFNLIVVFLNTITVPILDFKLGYYMAAQGSLIVFVILIFWFAAKQNAIDEEFGVNE